MNIYRMIIFSRNAKSAQEDKSMEVTFRMATLNDLDEIDILINNAINRMVEHNIFQWDDRYPTCEDFQEDIEKKQLYVGIIDNQIAVIYALNQESDEEYANGNWKHMDKPFYVIHRLCVNPVFQQKGISKITLSHIEKQLKDLDIHAIRLDVFSKNPFALNLYRKHGYSVVGQVNWRKGMFYLMEKYF